MSEEVKNNTVVATLTAKQADKFNTDNAEVEGWIPLEERKVTVEYIWPLSIEEAINRFGEKVCLNLIEGHALFGLQGTMRRLMSQGKTDEEIQEFVNTWKPGVSTRKPAKSLVEKLKEKAGESSPEDIAAMKAELEGLLAQMEG